MQKKKRVSKTDWGEVDLIQERDINYSEIPELDKQFWKKAKLVMPENKTNVTIRLDKDVTRWFKSRGKGYQTRINAVLKSCIQAQS